MSKKITIHKYQGNTDWSISVEDSFGTEHHLGYSKDLTGKWSTEMIELRAKNIWSIEEEPKEDSLSRPDLGECRTIQ